MKRLILVLLLLVVYSCSSVNKVSDQRNLPESGRTMYIERFEMDGHDYISYTFFYPQYGRKGESTTIVHDPECEKADFYKILQENFEN